MSKVDAKLLHAQNQAEIAFWRDFHDLRVPVIIELGRTKLTVQDIMNLEQFSIIQLDRSTGAGVDVIASSRCFARGEIIAVEDRTSIRLNEILNQIDSKGEE